MENKGGQYVLVNGERLPKEQADALAAQSLNTKKSDQKEADHGVEIQKEDSAGKD